MRFPRTFGVLYLSGPVNQISLLNREHERFERDRVNCDPAQRYRLLAALKDDDAAVRSAAALAISMIGPEAAAAVPNLMSLLKDQGPIARQQALAALHNIGPAAEPAVEALKEALKDEALYNSMRAAMALGRIGEFAIPALIEALTGTNVGTGTRAAAGLRSLGPTAREAIPALAAALYDSDDWVRRHACWAIASMGTDAKEALPALRQRLKDLKQVNLLQYDVAEAMLKIDRSAADAAQVLKSEGMLRHMPLFAASALALVPAGAETALPLLLKGLGEGTPDAKQGMAIIGFGRLGPKIGAPAVPKLQAIARNVEGSNRLEAAQTLVTLTGKPDELLTVIDQALASPPPHKSSERRVAALKALAKLGPPDQQLTGKVIQLLNDYDWAVREAARAATRQIDASRAKDESPGVKPVQEPAPAAVVDPMASFARMVGGEWKVTFKSGTSMYDTCHWGPGQHSGRVMTHGEDAAGNPWRGLGVVYWHPGRKQLCTLSLSPYEGSVSEDTITVVGDTSESVADLYQNGVHRKLVSRTTFDGPDKYHTTLLEEVEPGKLTPMNE